MSKRADNESASLVLGLEERLSSQVPNILDVWDGLNYGVANKTTPWVLDLMIHRGPYEPSYLARLDLKARTCTSLGPNDPPDYPGLLTWLYSRLEQLGYRLGSKSTSRLKSRSR
jgi:hypothetical protein